MTYDPNRTWMVVPVRFTFESLKPMNREDVRNITISMVPKKYPIREGPSPRLDYINVGEPFEQKFKGKATPWVLVPPDYTKDYLGEAVKSPWRKFEPKEIQVLEKLVKLMIKRYQKEKPFGG